MTTNDFNSFCSFIDNLSITVKDVLKLCNDKKILQNFLDILNTLYENHHIDSEKIAYFDDNHILISGKVEPLKNLIDDLTKKIDSIE